MLQGHAEKRGLGIMAWRKNLKRATVRAALLAWALGDFTMAYYIQTKISKIKSAYNC